AERRDVVRGVAGAPGYQLGGVVFQDQHRRFARHPRHLAVDELVGNHVADNHHPAARKAVDQPEQPLLALGFAGLRGDGTRDQHRINIQLAAAARLSTTASAATPSRGRCSSIAPVPVLTSTARAPTARARLTSPHLSPTTNERAGSRLRSRAARAIRPGRGLRQSQASAYSGSLPSGWWG